MLLDIRSYDGLTDANLAANHTSASGGAFVSAVNPRTGAKCLSLGSGLETVRHNGNTPLDATPFPNHAAHILAFALRPGVLPAGTTVIAKIVDGTVVQGTLVLDSTGALRVYRGDSAALLGSSAAGLIPPALYSFIEWRYIVDAAAGDSKVRITGIERIILSGVNTKAGANSYANGYSLHGSTIDLRYDDLYFLDGTASAPGPINNNFLGDCRALLLLAASDGTTNNWTPSSGANRFSRVNEVPHDGDASYVSSANAGDIQLFHMSTLASLSGQVYGVKVSAVVRKDDVDARTVAITCRPGAVNSFGTAAPVPTTYGYVQQVLNYDPEGLTGWTALAVNTAQFGIKLVT